MDLFLGGDMDIAGLRENLKGVTDPGGHGAIYGINGKTFWSKIIFL
jgi:hypothetical protein